MTATTGRAASLSKHENIAPGEGEVGNVGPLVPRTEEPGRQSEPGARAGHLPGSQFAQLHGQPGQGLPSSVRVVLGAAFVILADISIVNIAAPSIHAGLGASGADVQLIIVAYQLAYATLLIVGGRLGDVYGRNAVFRAGLFGFIMASAACGLALTSVQLIGARVLQGAAAALLYPQVVATINLTTDSVKRAKSFAALGAVISLSTIAGPLIAGMLLFLNVAGAGWRSVFLINVPVGLVIVYLARSRVPSHRSASAQRPGAAGALLLAASLLSVMVPMIVGRATGWPPWTFVGFAAAPGLFRVFAHLQNQQASRGQMPLLPPGLWKDRAFRLGVGFYVIFYSGVVCFFLYYSIVLQNAFHLSPFWAALVIVPYAVGSTAGSLCSGRLVPRFGGQRLMVVGSAICALGTALMQVPLGMVAGPWVPAAMAPTLLVTGVGLGLVVGPSLTVILSRIEGPDVGAASGALSTAGQVGGAFGVALLGIFFFGWLGTDDVGGVGAEDLTAALRSALGVSVATFLMASGLASLLGRPHKVAPTGADR